MKLIERPRDVMLANALQHVASCRRGGTCGDALLLRPYVDEGYFTPEQLGITRETLDAWHAEAMKHDYDES